MYDARGCKTIISFILKLEAEEEEIRINSNGSFKRIKQFYFSKGNKLFKITKLCSRFLSFYPKQDKIIN